LLTPQNAAFIVIDYQPVQVNSSASMERQRLVSNIIRASKAAVTYGLPIVHSTINVKTGINKPPIAPLRKVLERVPTYDRTTINAWEDIEPPRTIWPWPNRAGRRQDDQRYAALL
jgi:nicotinamidase-related amidase